MATTVFQKWIWNWVLNYFIASLKSLFTSVSGYELLSVLFMVCRWPARMRATYVESWPPISGATKSDSPVTWKWAIVLLPKRACRYVQNLNILGDWGTRRHGGEGVVSSVSFYPFFSPVLRSFPLFRPFIPPLMRFVWRARYRNLL